MKRALALILPVVLVLAACGGDDGGGGSASIEEWCAYGEDIREQGDIFASVNFTDPESLKTSIETLRSTLDSAVRAAPAEIRDDVEVSKQAFDRFYAALDDAGFDVFQVDPAVFEEFGAEAEVASERIEEYNERVCGLEPAADVDESGGATVSTDVPLNDLEAAMTDLETMAETMGDEQFQDLVSSDEFSALFVRELIAQFESQGFTTDEARCIAEAYDLAAILSGEFDPQDPASTLGPFEECGIGTDRLAEIGGGLGGG